MQAIRTFQSQNPSIVFAFPGSAEFDDSGRIYDTSNTAIPLAVAQPKTTADVALLVKLAATANVPFTLRVGGHDTLGRSVAADALLVDMRGLNSIAIDESALVVAIGGGVVSGELVAALELKGLAACVGTVPWVGYAGFSTMGGYGPLASTYGLGVDQIVGATVVTADGNIVEADAELLKGIRGAGGNFGVIVELQVKVHKLENFLSGMIMFEASDIAASFKNYNTKLAELAAKEPIPDTLDLQPLAVNSPMGRLFAVMVSWTSSDEATGRAWTAKIAALGTAVHNDFGPLSLSALLNNVAKVVPPYALGVGSRAVSVRKMSPGVVEVIGKHLALMPADFGAAISVHELKGKSAVPTDSSVFGAREPHFMIELIATVLDGANADEVKAWGTAFAAELMEAARASGDLLEAPWVPMTPDEHIDLKALYGRHYETVVGLKRKFDKDNFFKYALPKIQDV
ncbi:D-lactate dehydrogenase [Mycena kentingensis (nom. inval.)]|nr:D-lactate dehydrogenase [Mycena kentingensis (nom. inval.)]